jgi:Zn2+/Cd2+-exporting ATPase
MKAAYLLDGLDCALCSAKIEKAVGALDGVSSAFFNLITGKMTIEGDETKIPQIEDSLRSVVKKYEPHVVVKKV